MAQKRVLIIGGGIIGAASAYYLAKRDWQVTILERGRFGEGCSHGNCGLIVYSHVLPLNQPGTITNTLLRMLSKDSPFHLKFSFDLARWLWLLRFARNCRESVMLASARACAKLLASSQELYNALLREERIECEWQQHGSLLVYKTDLEMEAYAKTAALLQEQFGLEATRCPSEALSHFEPALKGGLAGGWFYPHDAHLRPEKLLASWRAVLEYQGVVIREQCDVQSFIVEEGRGRAAQTSLGEMPAEAMVVAAGALSPLLSRQLGCRIPIQPGKGYSLTMQRPSNSPKIPLLLQEHGVVVTPMDSCYRLGSTMEFAGYDKALDPRRLKVLKHAAEIYLHDPYTEPFEEQWFGWRPMTYDGKPLIGPTPALQNVFLAAGHNMLGMTMAPATGKLIAELVNREPPHLDPQPFSPSRF